MKKKTEIHIVFLDDSYQIVDTKFLKNSANSSSSWKFVLRKAVHQRWQRSFSDLIRKIRRSYRYAHYDLITISSDGPHQMILSYLNTLRTSVGAEKLIAITKKQLPEHHFAISDNQNVVLLTINNWGQLFRPPPVEVFLIKEIMAYSLQFSRNSTSKTMLHKETKGCIFDFCYRKIDIKASLWGSICSECSMKLKNWGITRTIQEESIDIIQKSISYNFKVKEDFVNIRPNFHLLDSKSYDIKPRQIFVVIAFDLLDTVYVDMKETLEKDRYNVTNGESRLGQMIIKDIWKLMNESELVIVDFSLGRPNVYLEFGMALVLGKPIVVLTQDESELPSDVRGMRYLKYKNTKGDTTFSKLLPKAIEDTIDEYS